MPANRMHVPAIVLAAGRSNRMGCPKLMLPWGSTTVIGHIVRTLVNAGCSEVLVITGESHKKMDIIISRLAKDHPVHTVFNQNHLRGGMLASLQAGLREMGNSTHAALVALGDQPQVEEDVVRGILEAYADTDACLVVPSFNMQRGHPWLVAHRLWHSLLSLTPPFTLRDFLNNHADEIYYVPVNTQSILKDLDTSEDYDHDKPG